MEIESYKPTEEERKQMAKELFEKVKNFPPEAERKDAVFNSLNEILKAIGSYLNDSSAAFERVVVNGQERVVYRDNYGEHFQSIQGDDPKALFVDALKLLLKNVRELNGAYSDIKLYFEEEKE